MRYRLVKTYDSKSSLKFLFNILAFTVSIFSIFWGLNLHLYFQDPEYSKKHKVSCLNPFSIAGFCSQYLDTAKLKIPYEIKTDSTAATSNLYYLFVIDESGSTTENETVKRNISTALSSILSSQLDSSELDNVPVKRLASVYMIYRLMEQVKWSGRISEVSAGIYHNYENGLQKLIKSDGSKANKTWEKIYDERDNNLILSLLNHPVHTSNVTDFKKIIQDIRNNYLDASLKNRVKKNDGKVVLVLISDFLHDSGHSNLVEVKKELNDMCNENDFVKSIKLFRLNHLLKTPISSTNTHNVNELINIFRDRFGDQFTDYSEFADYVSASEMDGLLSEIVSYSTSVEDCQCDSAMRFYYPYLIGLSNEQIERDISISMPVASIKSSISFKSLYSKNENSLLRLSCHNGKSNRSVMTLNGLPSSDFAGKKNNLKLTLSSNIVSQYLLDRYYIEVKTPKLEITRKYRICLQERIAPSHAHIILFLTCIIIFVLAQAFFIWSSNFLFRILKTVSWYQKAKWKMNRGILISINALFFIAISIFVIWNYLCWASGWDIAALVTIWIGIAYYSWKFYFRSNKNKSLELQTVEELLDTNPTV